MRLAQVLVPGDHREEVLAALEELGVDHAVTDDSADPEDAVVFFPVPTDGVEPVFDRLHERGLDRDSFTVLTKVESASSERFGNLQKRLGDGGHSGLPRSELHWKVREITWGKLTYHVGTLISVLVAAAGLLLDSVALVVGAMVIAPQVSTAISASVGVVLADWTLFLDSVRKQVLGLGAAVLAAAGFTWLVRLYGAVPPATAITQIELVTTRLAPGLLSTLGALGAGAAGAFGFTTEQTDSLVGVMIAAAIIPAAAATGIAIAWPLPLVALGASLLLAVNLLAINVGSLLTLGVLGYTPEAAPREWLPGREQATTVAVAALLIVGTVGVGALTYSHMQFEQPAKTVVQNTVEEPRYEDLDLVQVRAEFAGLSSTVGPPRVTVTLSRPSNRQYPSLASDLEERIERRTDTDVDVRIVYRESDASP